MLIDSLSIVGGGTNEEAMATGGGGGDDGFVGGTRERRARLGKKIPPLPSFIDWYCCCFIVRSIVCVCMCDCIFPTVGDADAGFRFSAIVFDGGSDRSEGLAPSLYFETTT